MKLAIAAIVKNELSALLEWIAYHRLAGVSTFLIADNGSSDGTREVLGALQQLGMLTVIDVPDQEGVRPQLGAYRQLLALCPSDIDALAFIDADEFLVSLGEDINVLPWLSTCFADPKVSAVALNWACFGSSHQLFRDEGLVITRFQQRAGKSFFPNHHYKTVVRPRAARSFENPHHADLLKGAYVDAQGQSLQLSEQHGGGISAAVIWSGVRVNHYVTKSLEEFLIKKSARGSAAAFNRVKHRDYFLLHDRNDEHCDRAARWGARVLGEAQDLVRLIEASCKGQAIWLDALRLEMTYYTVADPIRNWHLDSPGGHGGSRADPNRGVFVQGWVVFDAAYPQRAVVVQSSEGERIRGDIDVPRPDVISKVLHEPSERHPQLRCGFEFYVPAHFRTMVIGFEVNSRFHLAKEVRLTSQTVTAGNGR